MRKTIIFILIFVFAACDDIFNNYHFPYEDVTVIIDIPVNLEGINSNKDDYNSDLSFLAKRHGIYFSSNRNSGGNNFDIVFKNLDISYHQEDDVLVVEYTDDYLYGYQAALLPFINTDYNEFGPLYLWGGDGYEYFFYANNATGNYDIKFAYSLNSDFGTYDGEGVINGPINLDIVNSESDDLYPTINQEKTELFFCSNREDSIFSIYNVDIPSESVLMDYFIDTTSLITTKNTVLSSSSNDKCPYIDNNLLVFVSDREGGYGGFDLYYSQLIDGEWSEPVNFGATINSEYDEYRPITFGFDFFEHIVIFSSNRPGGKGGFDLYMVRTDKLIK